MHADARKTLTLGEANLIARVNDASKPLDAADRAAIVKLVERLDVFILTREMPCKR